MCRVRRASHGGVVELPNMLVPQSPSFRRCLAQSCPLVLFNHPLQFRKYMFPHYKLMQSILIEPFCHGASWCIHPPRLSTPYGAVTISRHLQLSVGKSSVEYPSSLSLLYMLQVIQLRDFDQITLKSRTSPVSLSQLFLASACAIL